VTCTHVVSGGDHLCLTVNPDEESHDVTANHVTANHEVFVNACSGSFGGDAVAPPAAGFALALTVLLLVGHGAAAQTGMATTQGATSSMSTVSPLPSRAPLTQMAPPSVAEGRIGAASNPGLVTGFGPGGTTHAPGTPTNAPYVGRGR